MSNNLKLVIVLISGMVLASCGGSGTTQNAVEQPIEDTSAIRQAAGGEPLNLSTSEISKEIKNLQSSSTKLLATNLFFPDIIFRFDCSGAKCDVPLTGETVYISDGDPSAINFESVMTRNGIKVAQGVGNFLFEDDSSEEQQVYGGWMNHGYFFVVHRQRGFEGDDSIFDYDLVYGFAIGESSGSVPSAGSATWNGVMVGADLQRWEGLQGDAILLADFQNRNMNLEFKNIRNLISGAIRNDFAFNNVPFTSDGFSQGSWGDDSRIAGTFYGTDHKEVGGMFEYEETIVGSFGAIRE